MTTKTCTKCGEVKPLDCFSRKSASRDGRRSNCKTCCNAAAETYRNQNQATSAARKVYAETYRKAHPEKYAKYRKAYEKARPEHARAKACRRRDALGDSYVRAKLHLHRADCPPELIAAKREQLQIHRLTQQLKKEIQNV